MSSIEVWATVFATNISRSVVLTPFGRTQVFNAAVTWFRQSPVGGGAAAGSLFSRWGRCDRLAPVPPRRMGRWAGGDMDRPAHLPR